jgi:hypothetical protein
MNLNLSKFKKVKADDRSTHLLHPDGHIIQIAHNGLKPRMKKELEAIPMYDGGIAGAGEDIADIQANNGVPSVGEGLRSLGHVVSNVINSIPPEPPVSQGAIDLARTGQWPEDKAPSAPQVVSPAHIETPQTQETVAPREIAAQSSAVSPLMKAEQDSARGMVNANNSGIQGYKDLAEAKGKIGTAEAKQYEHTNNAIAEAEKKFTEVTATLTKDGDTLWKEMSDPKSNVNPEHFWQNHSKIASAIGILLSGFRTEAGENPAAKYIQQQMDMDLRAQEANLGKKKSLLEFNLHRFGNVKDAYMASRVAQNDMLINNIHKIAAENASPMAKAQAQIESVQLKQQNAQLIHKLAMSQALMSLNKTNADSVNSTMQYLRATNPEKAKELEPLAVPGIGFASVPVPEKAREEMTAMQDLDHKLQKLETFAKKHQGTVLDRGIINEGKTLAADATSAARKAGGMGVYREGEQHFIEQLIDPDPTKFAANIRTTPKYKALRDSNKETLRANLKRFGLPESAAESAPEMKTVNGVKYMRGADGKAVRVK